ncbi:hypothetical protein B0H11DRAFT_2116026 [Mycena galericulata]|nr:hypothetical protein B0H11DRAFT_2116026 [Mycena galericulata]
MPLLRTPFAVQELVDYCIDFLHTCTPELKACALVSRSWSPAAQMHLFNCISIGFGVITTPDDLETIIRRWHCVCEVLSTSAKHREWVDSLEVDLHTASPDILIALSDLYFPRIRRIYTACKWSASETTTAIQKLFSHQTLSQVELYGSFDSLLGFTQIFENCSRHIKTVSFWQVYIGSNSSIEHLPPCETKIPIEVLSLLQSDTIHHWLNSPQCPFEFSTLKHLALDLESASVLDQPAISGILPRTERLSIQRPFPTENVTTTISLVPFTNLTYLELANPSDEFSWALQILSTLPRTNRVEIIRFPAPDTRFPDGQSGPEVDKLVLALRSPHLRAVELLYPPNAPPPVPAPEEHLLLLKALNLVRVRYS